MFQKAFSMGCLGGDAEAYVKHNKDCGQGRVGEAGLAQPSPTSSEWKEAKTPRGFPSSFECA
jgi:hypothetical protein